MNLPEISDQQEHILNSLNNRNIVVDSVAGSGKTTTNLYIAKNFGDSEILLLTYNSKLKIETRKRVKSLKIKNLETHSYHSFCVKYYNHICFTDTEIRKILKSKTPSNRRFNYDIIILDEAQDITPLYYELVSKINSDNCVVAKFCLLGDKNQSIYDFNKADARYIIYADQLFDFNTLKWKMCKLDTSFRVPSSISRFVNHCMLKTKRIRSHNSSKIKPKYIICDVYPNEYYVDNYQPYLEIKKIFKQGYGPEDIFILSPSLKSLNCPARSLENYLKSRHKNIPIYVPSNDEERLDDTIIKGKLIFSTFHQVKGLERKVVIIFGFDDSYFKYYKRDSDTMVCPNELYVATTRALERMILFHNTLCDYLPFIDRSKLSKYTDLSGYISAVESNVILNEIPISVTEIVKYLPQDVIDACIEYLEIVPIKNPGKKIPVPHKIKNNNLNEAISDINGIAIPSLFEYKNYGRMEILDYCINPNKFEMEKLENEALKKFWEKNVKKLKQIRDDGTIEENILYISTVYNSLNSKYLFKSYQIENYDWINQDTFKKCNRRLESLKISQLAKMEVNCVLSNKLYNDVPEILNRKIIGRYDCKDGNIIYEFKCVDKLEQEHYLQLAIYMYIDKVIYHRGKKKLHGDNKYYENGKAHYYLFNILTGQLDEIKCGLGDLKKIIKFLFKKKFLCGHKISDTDFINKNIKIGNKYL